MLRNELSDALPVAMKAKDGRAVSTVRLILAALKDRDIAARGKGNSDGIEENEILQMLQTMIKQRHESIEMYEKGARMELAQQEREEIDVIKRFLPEQMTEDAATSAIMDLIKELGADGLKDMGRIMAALRERYAGRMDFAKASGLVKAQLS
ncbi:MAG TPA: GatB/YqeY domain-containing protein [Alphaproteobacteria bacterium]|nr:GatB/YqeY domain-containing protein [Alphaproteobacteria bacterium]